MCSCVSSKSDLRMGPLNSSSIYSHPPVTTSSEGGGGSAARADRDASGEGCPWRGRVGSYFAHLEECGLEPVECRFFFFFFFFTLVTGPSRSLSFTPSDTRVYEPQIRARAGSARGSRFGRIWTRTGRRAGACRFFFFFITLE